MGGVGLSVWFMSCLDEKFGRLKVVSCIDEKVTVIIDVKVIRYYTVKWLSKPLFRGLYSTLYKL